MVADQQFHGYNILSDPIYRQTDASKYPILSISSPHPICKNSFIGIDRSLYGRTDSDVLDTPSITTLDAMVTTKHLYGAMDHRSQLFLFWKQSNGLSV